MTSIAASGIAIILGIAVFILLAYKGLSPILASLVAAVIVGFTCEGGPFTAIFETFMGQAVDFMSNVLLLIVVGGLLAAVLEITGTTDSLAAGIIRLLGEKSIPIVVFVMTGLLCFLGVGSYQFIVAPLALGLLRKANLPRNIGLIAMMVGYNAVTYCLPGTSVTPNLMPTMILGTNIYAGGLLGIVAFILATALGLGYVYCNKEKHPDQCQQQFGVIHEVCVQFCQKQHSQSGTELHSGLFYYFYYTISAPLPATGKARYSLEYRAFDAIIRRDSF